MPTTETTAREIEQAQAHLLELEAEFARLFQRSRHHLLRAADEARRLRAEAEEQRFEALTEEQAAARLGMSRDTLARERAADPDFPHYRAGSRVLYASFHLAENVKRLEPRARKGKR